MRVLVTGGLGYLGGRISAYLAAQPGLSVRVGTSRPPAGTLIAGAEIVPCDVLSDENLSAACVDVDAVIHLAALNEIDSLADPQRALRVTTGGTVSLMKAARTAGVRRIIYFSTAHVYGAPLAGHITEETLPRPAHPYAITHRAAEDFVLAARSQDMDGIVLRLSNAVGAPLDPAVNRWTLLVNDLCRQAVTTRRMVLRSSGLQYRDFICMSDVCRAVGHMLESAGTRPDGGMYNVGAGVSRTVKDMAVLISERCREVLGFLPQIIRPEENSTDSTHALTYACDKLLQTGFIYKGRLEDEIDDTVRLCRAAFSS